MEDKRSNMIVFYAALGLAFAFVYGIGQIPKAEPGPGPYQIKTMGEYRYKLNTQTGETWYSASDGYGIPTGWIPLR